MCLCVCVLLLSCEKVSPRTTSNDCSYGEISGLKWLVFGQFDEVLASSKPHTALYIGPFTPQICADLSGVKNSCKIGGNPLICGNEAT